MALTIQIKGKGVIANADASPDSAMSGSLWNELGGGADSFSPDTYLFGSMSFAGAYSSKSGFQYFDVGSGNELDFSQGGAEEGQFIVMPICCPTIGLLQTLEGYGLAIRLGTDQSNYREWAIAGSDDSNGWLGTDWKPFIVDPTDSGTRDVGTYNSASIRYMGIWIDAASLAKGDNIFISQILCCSGLKITGTSTDFWKDVIAYCTDYPNRAFTIMMEKEGIGFALAGFTIGDSAQAAVTEVSGVNQTVKFGRSEYWNGSAWVSTYPAAANLIEFESNGSYATDYELTDSSIAGAEGGFVEFNTVDGDAIILNGGSTVNATPTFKSGDSLNGHVFAGCNAVIPSGAAFDNVSINATAEAATGAMELVAASDLSVLSHIFFNGYSGQYALYIPATITGSITLDGFIVDGSGIDIYWGGAAGTLVVNLVGGSNLSSWNSAGGTVDIQNSASLTLTGVEDNTEVRLYTSDLTTEIFGVENSSGGTVIISYSGTYVDAVLVIHHLNYRYPRTILQLDGVDATLPINQEYDTTYSNPA